jgi:hypothetical protein
MKKYLLILAAFVALPANAVLIEIDDEQWNVEALSAAVQSDGVEDLLRSQTWWANPDRAYAFADEVREQLGMSHLHLSDTPWYYGPLFATEVVHGVHPIYVPVLGMTAFFGDRPGGEFIDVVPNKTIYGLNGWFAVATLVSAPEPGTLSLLAVGVLGVLAARRRTHVAANA